MSPRTEALFNDRLFVAPSERINVDDVFALSEEMQHFLSARLTAKQRGTDPRVELVDAIYVKGQLRLDYDSATTRNAAQAFAARSGNCLSLVIMTAAFARAMGLPVQFQSVYVDQTVVRDDDMLYFIGHVNLNLGTRQGTSQSKSSGPELLTVDFLPPSEAQRLRTRRIGDETIVAMYMNNKAAEAIARGKLDDAYWWARAAVAQAPDFLSIYNTLGVLYRRHGNPAEARKVLAYALERDPENTHAMANLVGVLNDLGQTAEAKNVARKLERLEPNPPYGYFDSGLQAMRDGNYPAARDLFAKEVERSPHVHEFHFWLANAYAALGDAARARSQMLLALEYSATGREHDLYATKLARLKSGQIR